MLYCGAFWYWNFDDVILVLIFQKDIQNQNALFKWSVTDPGQQVYYLLKNVFFHFLNYYIVGCMFIKEEKKKIVLLLLLMCR